jgi:hypothetical protein
LARYYASRRPRQLSLAFAGKVSRGLLSFIPPIEVFDGGAMPLLR